MEISSDEALKMPVGRRRNQRETGRRKAGQGGRGFSTALRREMRFS